MRRLASIFTVKKGNDKRPDNVVRDDRDPSGSDTSHRQPSSTASSAIGGHHASPLPTRKGSFQIPTNIDRLSPASSSPSTPQLHSSNVSDNSSSGSASVRTPDDDINTYKSISTARSTSTRSKKSLFSWLPSKKPEPARPPVPHQWEPSHPAPTLRLPPAGNRFPINRPSHQDTSDSEDVDCYEDDEQLTVQTASRRPTRSAVAAQFSPANARTYFRRVTENSLIPKSAQARPCYTPKGCPFYPRSCHNSKQLPRLETLQSRTQKTLLLRNLDRCTDAELHAIASFGLRPVPAAFEHVPVSDFNEVYPDPERVSSTSAGLDQWLSRPCFESRFKDWKPIDGQIASHHITGTGFGVADLEYSEATEALAGYEALGSSTVPPIIAPSPPEKNLAVDTSSSAVPSVTSATPPMLSVPRSSYIAHPSPLRNEHGLPESSNSLPSRSSLPSMRPSLSIIQPSPSSPSISSPQSPPTATPGTNNVSKRGVRFAEDDKDEQIPLGYVLRQKQRKAQKAQFLREEQERRKFETERAKVEEERRKREQERLDWERERKAWEEEKRKVEEEKRNRLYAEEVANARQRREAQRAGYFGRSGSDNSSQSLLPSSSSGSLQERSRSAGEKQSYIRPVYDPASPPRRLASEPIVSTTNGLAPSPTSSNSRPSSVAQSRPPSMYSSPMSSVEDFRSASARKRQSGASSERSSSYVNPPPSTWMHGSPNVVMVPVVPSMYPYFVTLDNSMSMNMPLLPPTPPFFGESRTSRSRSRQSSSSSRGSGQDSTENVNQKGQPRRDSAMYNNVSRSSSHLPQTSTGAGLRPNPPTAGRGHQRRYSGDVVGMSPSSDRGKPATATGATRGRTMHQQPKVPSPWTALPSTRGSYTPVGNPRQSVYS